MPRKLVEKNDGSRSAIVLGPTGATGKYLVYNLLKSKDYSKVTIIHRRLFDIDKELLFDERYKKEQLTLTAKERNKLSQHVINMDNLNSQENEKYFSNHDVLFCALGTTRNTAGTAENFAKVDVGYVSQSAKISKRMGIKHYSLLTAKGANKNVYNNIPLFNKIIPQWMIQSSILHGLWYMKCKGDAEQAVIDEKFVKTSIFRPGMLLRPEADRMGEKFLHSLPFNLPFLHSTHVRDVAKTMILDSQSDDNDHGKNGEPIFYEKEMIDNIAHWYF